MSVKSFDQKVAAQWAIIRAHPDTSATTIYKRYKGTEFGMRKQDSLSLTKQLKDANELRIRNENSSMGENTRKRVNKGGYIAAKKQSMAGKRKYPPKEGVRTRTIRETIEQMYKQTPINDYYEFY